MANEPSYAQRGITRRQFQLLDTLTGQIVGQSGPFADFGLAAGYIGQVADHLGQHPVQVQVTDTNAEFCEAIVQLTSGPMPASMASDWASNVVLPAWGGSGP